TLPLFIFQEQSRQLTICLQLPADRVELDSWRDNPKTQSQYCSQPVQWSSILVLFEQAESDVLILLNCCAAETANTRNSISITKLIVTYLYSGIVNGVGRYSFTNALVAELYELSQKPSFSTGELYSNIFRHIQIHSEKGRDRPGPVHLPLTKQSSFPRSIQLSVRNPTSSKDGLDFCGGSLESSANVPQQEKREDIKPNESVSIMNAGSFRKSLVPRILFAVRLKESF
ncbi:hypothetical protein DL95DRAFT_487745, partial [Leptodontidium sp. 2 PMI_412]